MFASLQRLSSLGTGLKPQRVAFKTAKLSHSVESMAFHQNFDTRLWVAIFTFTAFCILFCLATLFYLVYQFARSDKSSTITTKVKIYSTFSITFFIMAQIFSMLYTVYIKLPDGQLNTVTESLWSMYNTFWSFGYFFTYLLLFERLQRTFAQTAYALTIIHSLCFGVLVMGYLLSQIGNSLCWFLFVIDHFSSWQQFNTLYNQLLWTRLVIDLVLNIFIVVLFCRRIVNLTQTKRASLCVATLQSTNSEGSSSGKAGGGNSKGKSNGKSNGKRAPSPTLNRHHFKIYNAMIKYFTLCSWTVLSTQMFTVTQLVLSDSIQHAVDNGLFEYYYTAYALYYVAGNVDAIISTAFVVLSFSFSDRSYDRFCGCAHSKCLWIWDNVRLPSPRMSPEMAIAKMNTQPSHSVAMRMPSGVSTVTLAPAISVSMPSKAPSDYRGSVAPSDYRGSVATVTAGEHEVSTIEEEHSALHTATGQSYVASGSEM